MTLALQQNAQGLERELTWLTQIIDARFKLYFGQEAEVKDIFDLPPPDLEGSASPYAELITRHKMNFAERLAIVLALVPHVRPQLLDVFYTKNKTFDREFTEFGGVFEGPRRDFFPTGETLVFLVGGDSLDIRFSLQPLFGRDHFFSTHNILDLKPTAVSASPLRVPLRISPEYLSLLTTGEATQPPYSSHFPVQRMDTELSWQDLVLPPKTFDQVKEIESWIEHGKTVLSDWGMAGKIHHGHRAMFYGPPGTGKSLSVSLLGKSTGYEVYRVNLSTVISRYIGETEKNLARVFDLAEHKNGILFFDEADALFGKRSETRNAHDRYANQEVSYLLQRIEAFEGISILASNLNDPVDPAFARRFESLVYFPMPGPQERERLWKQGFSEKARLDEDIDVHELAKKYELSGGAIMNVIRFASLQALENGGNAITLKMILQGIKREYVKEGSVS